MPHPLHSSELANRARVLEGHISGDGDGGPAILVDLSKTRNSAAIHGECLRAAALWATVSLCHEVRSSHVLSIAGSGRGLKWIRHPALHGAMLLGRSDRGDSYGAGAVPLFGL